MSDCEIGPSGCGDDAFNANVYCALEAARLAEMVYGLDEDASIGYVAKKVIALTVGGQDYELAIRTLRDILRVAKCVPQAREEIEAKEEKRKSEAIFKPECEIAEQVSRKRCPRSLATRISQLLIRSGIYSIAQAQSLTDDELLSIHGMGANSVSIIREMKHDE